jgi:hypothetical protein
MFLGGEDARAEGQQELGLHLQEMPQKYPTLGDSLSTNIPFVSSEPQRDLSQTSFNQSVAM